MKGMEIPEILQTETIDTRVINQIQSNAIAVVVLGIYLSLTIGCKLNGIRSLCLYDKGLNLLSQEMFG